MVGEGIEVENGTATPYSARASLSRDCGAGVAGKCGRSEPGTGRAQWTRKWLNDKG